jgi:zinc protease
VVVVGDITADVAIRAMAATFAAGPVLPPRAEVVPHPVLPAPSAVPHVAFHQGRADQAYYGEYWLLPDYFTDPRGSYVGRVAAGVLQARLIDTVREKLGLTYTPMTDAAASVQLAGLGYLGAVLETPPANFPTFRALLDAQLADLAAKPVSADEFERARRPLIAGRAKDMEGNPFWSTWLPMVLRDPRVRQSVLETRDGLGSVTAEDVRALFARIAANKTPVTVVAKSRE